MRVGSLAVVAGIAVAIFTAGAAADPDANPTTPQTSESLEKNEDAAAASPDGEADVASEESDAGESEFFDNPLFGDEPDPLFDDDEWFDETTGYPDPLEEPNRAVLVFNQGLDTFLLGPITNFFGWVTPDPVKYGLRNFFANLNTPVVLINDMLQLEWFDAVTTTGAFVINTTVGIAGFFEPAAYIGMPRHESDFGQTLALARVPSGPYLMLPVTGPSTARGTVGSVVDFFLRPNTWILPVSNIYYYSGEGVVTLEHHREKMQELERSSVDYYSVLRSAYYQTRTEAIWGRREGRRRPGED